MQYYNYNGFNSVKLYAVNLNGYKPSDRLRYQLNINNLFDKSYYVSPSYSDLWVQLLELRTPQFGTVEF